MNGQSRERRHCCLRWTLAVSSLLFSTTWAAERSLQKSSRTRHAPRVVPVVIANDGITVLPTSSMEDSQGSVASPTGLPGVAVYHNDAGPGRFYIPGAGQRMADDIRLANGACNIVYYNLTVAGDGILSNGSTFDVDVELWDGDPCDPLSTTIPGTSMHFPGVANQLVLQTLEVPLAAPANSINSTIWMAVTFSTDSGGWVVGEQAETGFTADYWSENDTDAAPAQCTLFAFAPDPQTSIIYYAGFWSDVRCDVPAPTGACCAGQSCYEVTQAECVSGTWQGDFTTCSPSPCIVGTCCSGANLSTCQDTTEAQCDADGGLFTAGEVCSQNPCRTTFKVFANNFDVGSRTTINAGTKVADDLDLGAAAPCEMIGFDITMNSEPVAPDYDVHVEIWTNDEQGTPINGLDDIPLAPIPGASFDFTNVAGAGTEKKLVAGPFSGIQLDRKIWLVLTTTTPDAGPVLAGFPTIGSSRDDFAIYNDPASPGAWDPTYNFGGFDPNGCPLDPPCNPAASFRINVWCAGDPPPGACCDALSGTCRDDVPLGSCNGRWVQGATCASNPFDPPCGTSACCVTQPIVDCLDTSPSFCKQLGGTPAIGSLCDDLNFTCPRPLCLSATEDCSSVHTQLGCNDPFCCESVCSGDSFCCDVLDVDAQWDQACVDEASSCPAAPPCPAGPVTFVDPPSGIIDARQPYPPGNTANQQGYKKFLVSAPHGADNLLCWTPCESVVDTSSNMITSVVDVGDDMFEISLLRSISPGGITSISYEDDSGQVQTGEFTSHPANVNGDGLADGGDVTALMDCITGVTTCELEMCDVDRSGACTPADLLRAIDLLEGASPYTPWNGTPLPLSCP